MRFRGESAIISQPKDFARDLHQWPDLPMKLCSEGYLFLDEKTADLLNGV